ncbi:type II toxin-antitoxin system RelE/ParE family toxin [Stenomitos frigidus]|uniref:Addiction module antitoxin n=1 Tax=Stenomitos frigidus ULC18 TaxID=2107698 RepID=A0A2T1DVJ4_9CYAN|nr:type II toxin-antitoxin system RelE/ParE family toxin [Stenomitos frigidus]PSB24533.1 addiction module antitoxin [Stenomitos frigidus ULC18]
MPEPAFTQVLTTAEFKREARALKKRYRSIELDLQPLIEQLQNGDLPGDHIPGFADYIVYKVRVKNSAIRKGKSGGYRVIYQSLAPDVVVLLRLYSKSDQDDVTVDEIRAIIKKFQADTEST